MLTPERLDELEKFTNRDDEEMTREQLKAKFPYASEAFFAKNSATRDEAARASKSSLTAFVDAVADSERKYVSMAALVPRKKNYSRGKSRVVILVEIIRFGHKRLDDDNLIAGGKPLRDSIATSLGVDDADRRIQWRYEQVVTEGATGTLVRIQRIK